MSFRHLALASISTSLLLAACTGDTIIEDAGSGGAGSGGDVPTTTASTTSGDGDGDGGSPPVGPRMVSLDVRGWLAPVDPSDVDVYVHAADGTQKAALLDGTFPAEVEAAPGDLVTFAFPGGFLFESYRVTPEVEAIVGAYGGLPPVGCGPLSSPMRLIVDVPVIPGATDVMIGLSNGSTEYVQGGATVEIDVTEACPTLDLIAAAVDASSAVLGFEHVVIPVASGTEQVVDLVLAGDATPVLAITTSLPAGARAGGRAGWWGPNGLIVEDSTQERVAEEGAATFVYQPEVIDPGFGQPRVDVSVGLILEGEGSCDVADFHLTGSLPEPGSFDPLRLRWLAPSGDSWSTDGPGALGTRLLRHRQYTTDFGGVIWNVFEDPGMPASLVLPTLPVEQPLGELDVELLIHQDDGRGGYGESIAAGFGAESLIETRSAVPCRE